jgi:hypothetical protein
MTLQVEPPPPPRLSANTAWKGTSLCAVSRYHRLNMEVDLQSLFGLHVTWYAQLYSLAETLQAPQSSAFGLVYGGRYWSAKTDDILCNPLADTDNSNEGVSMCFIKNQTDKNRPRIVVCFEKLDYILLARLQYFCENDFMNSSCAQWAAVWRGKDAILGINDVSSAQQSLRLPLLPPIVLPYSMRVTSACPAGSRNCVLYSNPLTLYLNSSNIRRCLHTPTLANLGRNIYLYRSQLQLSSIFIYTTS